jgi:hypothetical protein
VGILKTGVTDGSSRAIRLMARCAGSLKSHSRWLIPAALALVWTAANAAKPLHIDDGTYYRFARQVRAHPLDPYGFPILYFYAPLPANHVLAPPIVPYWWAAGIALFGEVPWLWKLWFFPLAGLFVFSLWDLLQAFAPRHAKLMLFVTVLSPAVFPAYNLMLDIPLQALALTALALFRRAVVQGSLPKCVLSGVFVALAVETKYTGLLVPAVIGIYAGVTQPNRHSATKSRINPPGLALISILTGAVLVTTWEGFLLARYGESHLFFHLRDQAGLGNSKAQLVMPLLTLLGYLAPMLAIMALTISIRRAAVSATLVVIVVAAYVMLMSRPAEASHEILFASWLNERGSINVVDLVMSATGFLLLASLAGFARAACGRHLGPSELDPKSASNIVIDRFLFGWLALEVAGYFIMSPFAASRRIIGIAIVAALIIGREAGRVSLRGGCLAVFRSAAFGGMVLGLAYTALDWREAQAEREAAVDVMGQIRALNTRQPVWYCGYWGFQFYAERAGARQVIPAYSAIQQMSPSLLHKGDWLIVPHYPIPQQRIAIQPGDVEWMPQFIVDDWIPLRTAAAYYSGSRPLEPKAGPRVGVSIGRIRRDFLAEIVE